MGGRLRWCPYTPTMFIHPPYIWTPPYVQRNLIGYLFCYIIKCFPTSEAVMGVVRVRWCPYAPYIHIHPIHLDTPICSESFNRIFILLYHKMSFYFRGGLSDLGGIHMPPMFMCPLYVLMPPNVWTTPICSDAPKCMGASKHERGI